MTRFIPPKGMKSLGVTDARGNTHTLKQNKDGTFHVSDPKLAKKLKQEGLGEATASGSYRQDVGYTCNKCGFGSFFKQCSKCGEING